MSSRQEDYPDELQIGKNPKIYEASLEPENYEDWEAWFLTELIGYMPIRTWVKTGNSPRFALPKRSRIVEEKESDGTSKQVSICVKAEWDGEEGKLIWQMHCRSLMDQEKEFDRKKSHYCRIMLSHVGKQVLDKMKVTAVYD